MLQPSPKNSTIQSVIEEVSKIIIGKDSVIQLTLAAFLAGGHVLYEDVPGIGKTMLVKSLAKAMDSSFSRIQFTPDLLPNDIVGISLYDMKQHHFEFKKGPIFTDILLADEINRATPRTQAALLEAMSENQVTADGETYQLSSNFFVLATQNPLNHEGTYSLPEAQLDRFIMRLSMGYPTYEEELTLLQGDERTLLLNSLHKVLTHEHIDELKGQVQTVHVDRRLLEYALNLVQATRTHPKIILGISPRGALNFVKAAKAYAVTENRDYCLPEDFKNLVHPVFAHRIHLKTSHDSVDTVLDTILKQIKVPVKD